MIQSLNLPSVLTTSFEDSIAEVVAAEASAGFLSGLCFRHAVFHALEIADALAGLALGQVDTAARDAVTQVRLRKHNIAADGVAEAKVFINVCRNNFCCRNGFDNGCRSGCAVTAGKYARHIVKTTIALGLNLAAVNRKTGLLEVLELDILSDGHDQGLARNEDIRSPVARTLALPPLILLIICGVT